MDENVQSVPPQPSSGNSSGSPLMKIVIIVVLLGVLAGGGFLAYSFLQKPSTPTQTPSPRTTAPKETATHYVGSQTITLRDINGGSSSGSVTRNITTGRVTHSITANLAAPAEGQFYQAWMIKFGEPPFNVGTLSRKEDGIYTLETDYQFVPEQSSFTTFETIHNTIVISLETVDDNTLETRVLEGTFTE